ncbi:MAG: 1-(5-phosphoribosyl)-5-[(5-phosphoribosylamino)methylideneamino]imidazole-4-carboxamide isomerase [Ferruginibacter sp.]
MIIIPAIDLIDGKCVRLTQGDYAQAKVYHNNPVDVAKSFEDAGIHRLHLVDLDGAKAGKFQHLNVLEKIATATSLQIDYGGGVKQISDVAAVLNAGASMVTVGSIAAQHPELLEEWLMEFGASKFFVGADVLDEKVKISGWLKDSGKTIFSFIGQLMGLGVTQIFCTDISKDGAMVGPAFELYKNILSEHPELELYASGGVTALKDIHDLTTVGCKGVIIGKAIYEGNISLKELSVFGK